MTSLIILFDNYILSEGVYDILQKTWQKVTRKSWEALYLDAFNEAVKKLKPILTKYASEDGEVIFNTDQLVKALHQDLAINPQSSAFSQLNDDTFARELAQAMVNRNVLSIGGNPLTETDYTQLTLNVIKNARAIFRRTIENDEIAFRKAILEESLILQTGLHNTQTQTEAALVLVQQVYSFLSNEFQVRLLTELEDIKVELIKLRDQIQQNAEHPQTNSRIKELIEGYIAGSFNDDLYIELDQAGELDPDRKTLLGRVFVDLQVRVRKDQKQREFQGAHGVNIEAISKHLFDEDGGPAMELLGSKEWKRIVMIGGPGQGKSTLGQYLAQVHRVQWLNEPPWEFSPQTVRIPFRVVLKQFAQWLSDTPALDSLDAFLAHLVGRIAGSGSAVIADDIQAILQQFPCLLIFDGLDEVVSPKLRDAMLMRIRNFLQRVERLGYDLTILATSRPTGYGDEFDPDRFLHLELLPLSLESAYDFAEKWVQSKKLQTEEVERIIATFKECQEENNLANLMKTPLQVNIILLIIKSGGRPPTQREALFDEYWRIIFRREKGKAKGAMQIVQSDETLLLKLHSYLSYLLHRRTANGNVQSLLPENEFRQATYDFLRRDDSVSSEETILQKVEQLVREARDRLVLIVEPQQGLFGFELRSIQEFFAAVHLVQTAKDTNQRFERFEAIARTDHWRNVALFFAGRIARSYEGESSRILEFGCRPVNRENVFRYLKPGAWLALQIAADGALGNKRNLQHSAIEFGLTVLETGMTHEQERELESTLAQLSPEDQRDILKPVLENRIRLLPESRLKVALDLYAEIFGVTPLFQEKVDILLQSQNEDSVTSTLALAIRFKSSPDWLKNRLRKHLDWFRPLLPGWWSYSPEYMDKLLTALKLSEEEVTEMALAAIEHNERYYYFPDMDPITGFTRVAASVDSLLGQLKIMLGCISLINFYHHNILPRRRRFEGDVVEFEQGRIACTPLKTETLDDSSQISDKVIPILETLLGKADLEPWLRVLLWQCVWEFQEPNSSQVTAFVEEVSQIQQTGLLKNFIWTYPYGFQWPLLSLFLRNQRSFTSQTFEAWSLQLNPNNQLTVANQVIQAIREYLNDPNDKQIEDLFVAIKAGLGLERLFPDLLQLSDAIGIGITDLVKIHIRSINLNENFQFSNKTIRTLLAAAQNTIVDDEDDQVGLIRISTSLAWPNTSSTVNQAHRLFESILARCEDSPSLPLVDTIVMLFLKLMVYNKSVIPYASRLFVILSQTEITDSLRFRFDNLLVDLPGETLSELAVYLMDQDENIQAGAIIFWKTIVEAMLFFGRYSAPGIEFPNNIRFDPKVASNLINSDNDKNISTGIKLLIFSNFPDRNTEFQQDLLATMQKCEKASIESDWEEFLSETPIEGNRRTVLINMLESILNEPDCYSNSILNAAMARYQQLTRDLTITISEVEERELGLL